MSNWLNNFMSGLAFGMFAGNPFFRGMGGLGFGGGCCSGFGIGFGFGGISSTYYSGFANPFPSIFGGYMGGGYSSSAGLIMPQGFANNNFPQIDFATPCQTIWEAYTNPNSNYNSYMMDWFQSMNRQTNPFQFPNNVNKPIENSAQSQTGEDEKLEESVLGKNGNDSSLKSGSSSKRRQAEKSIKLNASNNPQSTSASAKSTRTDNTPREFADVYASLGIDDKRFQKIFEECVLSINEGRKKGRDFNIFDVKAMNKNGVLQTTYDDYRVKIKNLPKRDVSNMTMEEMCDIYYSMFYVKGGAKYIKDDKLALYVFDSDVNMGVGTGKTLLARSGNNAERFEEERRAEYKRRNGFNKYKRTWFNRIENTKKYADSNFSASA